MNGGKSTDKPGNLDVSANESLLNSSLPNKRLIPKRNEQVFKAILLLIKRHAA